MDGLLSLGPALLITILKIPGSFMEFNGALHPLLTILSPYKALKTALIQPANMGLTQS